MYHVLYVDDNPHLLEVARFFLEDTGEFSVTTTPLATTALSLPDLASFDAIIADYEMPLMDGITFLKKIRADHGTIPFILFTGKGREDVVIEAINNGADFYLQKGGDAESQFAELVHKIKKAVEQKRAVLALQASEQRYRHLYQHALVGLFETSLGDATVIACNQRYCDLFGFPSVEEAIGRDVLHLYADPADRAEVSRILHEQGFISNHEVLFINQATGDHFWGQFSGRINREKDVAEGTIIDITARKSAEENLRESQRALATLMGNLPGMVYRCRNDAAWTMEFVSEGAADLTGYEPSELIGNRRIAFADCIHPEDRDRVWRHIQEAIAGRRRYQVQYRILTRDGAEKWVWEQGLGIFSPEGELLTIEGFIIDITRRKKLISDLKDQRQELLASCEQLTAAKQELRAQFNRLAESERVLRVNEERLRMAQKMGNTGSWEYIPATNKIWGSAEGLRIFGFPPVSGYFSVDEIEARIPEQERVHQALLDLIAEGKEYNLEYAINPADGSSPRMIHSIAQLERDVSGRVIKVRGIVRDITDQKRAEEELVFKNILLSTQQETSPNAILIVDELGHILNYNQKFIEIWNLPEDLPARGKDEPVLQYVADQVADREEFLARVRYLYDHNEEKSFEELQLADGRILERFSSPMQGANGKYYGRVWYFRDITQRTRAGQALRESEETFRTLVEASADGIMLIDESGTVIEWNTALGTLTGIPRQEALGRSYGDLLEQMLMPGRHSPERIARILEEMKNALATGDSPYFFRKIMAEICRRDGTTRKIQQTVFPIRTSKGLRIGSISRDMTDLPANPP